MGLRNTATTFPANAAFVAYTTRILDSFSATPTTHTFRSFWKPVLIAWQASAKESPACARPRAVIEASAIVATLARMVGPFTCHLLHVSQQELPGGACSV